MKITQTFPGPIIAFIIGTSLVILHAGPRTSASYNVATDTADAGGKRTTSASYTNDGSAGAVTGLSTVAAPAGTAKSGYIGQLYDVTGLTLTAATVNVNETATLQLAAWQALDDATLLAVPAASVAWSVQSGPLTGISSGGLVAAGTVYQNTNATAQGSYQSFLDTLTLTVLNVNTDDFGLYAGDGLADDWQVLYFGVNNPNAAPLLASYSASASSAGSPRISIASMRKTSTTARNGPLSRRSSHRARIWRARCPSAR